VRRPIRDDITGRLAAAPLGSSSVAAGKALLGLWPLGKRLPSHSVTLLLTRDALKWVACPLRLSRSGLHLADQVGGNLRRAISIRGELGRICLH
jgi:hypothetical protein